MPLARVLVAIGFGALVLPATACRDADRGVFKGASVVLISIDTLRADRLPAYGYPAGSTPVLDRLAREGVLFEAVYSPAPQTLPAHASMFTGLIPPRHGVRDNIGFTLKPGPRTLAERFKAAGMATGAAVSSYVLRAPTGIARGFDAFDDDMEIEGGSEALGSAQRDGSAAVQSLGRWIEGQNGRFFAFLHLYEPHTPWAPPPAHARFAHPYDGEVAYVDELVGRFLEPLRAKGLLDRTIVAVTADHGEGLGDHGEEEHGVFLYREAVHVPLILRLPGAERRGTRVKGTAALVDLAPTLLAMAGVSADAMDGASLLAAVATGRTESRPVYSETLLPRYHFGWSELFAVTDDRYRFIRAPRPELFDVGRDPAEKTNVYVSSEAVARPMNAWLERQLKVGVMASREPVPAETQEKLEALGYVGTAAAPTHAASDLADPKDRIADAEELKKAVALRRSGKLKEAIVQYRKVLERNPAMVDAWVGLGLSLSDLGRPQEAIAAMDEVIKIDPSRTSTHLALARIHALHGRTERAVKHAEIASASDPGQAFELLAQLAMDRGDTTRAAELATRSVQADDRREMGHFILGAVAQRQGRCEEALRSFGKAAEALRLRRHTIVRNLHANMGDCLARLGREAEAEKEFRAEIETIPHTTEGRVGLATLYRSQGRDAEARAVLGGLIAAEPRPTADHYWTVVRTFAVLGDVEAARNWAAQARTRFPSDARFRGGKG